MKIYIYGVISHTASNMFGSVAHIAHLRYVASLLLRTENETKLPYTLENQVKYYTRRIHEEFKEHERVNAEYERKFTKLYKEIEGTLWDPIISTSVKLTEIPKIYTQILALIEEQNHMKSQFTSIAKKQDILKPSTPNFAKDELKESQDLYVSVLVGVAISSVIIGTLYL